MTARHDRSPEVQETLHDLQKCLRLLVRKPRTAWSRHNQEYKNATDYVGGFMLKDRAEFLRCLPHHYKSLAQARMDAFRRIKRSAECLNEVVPLLCIRIRLL